MPPIASRPIWFENFAELCMRWYNRQQPEVRQQVGGSAEASLHAEERARKVMAYLGLEALERLKTPRQWEVRWDAKAQWKRLEAILNQSGWDVIRHRGGATDLEWGLDAIRETERPSVVIADAAMRDFCQVAREEGLEIPLTVDDAGVLALAREVYDAAADRMGSRPRPWIDELAQPEFVYRVLGLPFHPFVFQLVA